MPEAARMWAKKPHREPPKEEAASGCAPSFSDAKHESPYAIAPRAPLFPRNIILLPLHELR